MRVLVLGGGRFQGLRAAEMLVEAGHEVVVANRSQAAPVGAQHRTADVTEAGVLESLLRTQAYDVLVDNLAYQPDHLQRLLPLLGGRVGQYVMVSSIVVYHHQSRKLYRPYTEAEVDLTVDGGGPYDVGKRQCEARLRTYSDVPWTILRFANIEGPGDPSNRRGFFIDRVADGHGLLIPSDHSQPYQPLWRDDAARAVCQAAGNPKAFGQTYNITGDEIFTLGEWLNILADVLGVPAPYLVQLPLEELRKLAGFFYRAPLPFRPLMDLTPAFRDLGWRPTSALHWLPATVAWWQNAGLTSGGWEFRGQEIDAIKRVRAFLHG